VGVGSRVLYNNSTGSANSALGVGALENYWGTGRNTAVGYASLTTLTIGSENTAIGYLSDVISDNLTNATAIGARAKVDCSNCLVLGSINGVGQANSNVNVGIGTTSPQASLHIASLGNINSPQMMVQNQNFLGDYARIRMKGVATTPWWDIAALSNSTASSAQLNFYFSGTGDILSLKGNGNAVLMGTLTQSSDVRLKKNIAPISSSLSRLLHLTGYNYQWANSAWDNSMQIGLLAQEVQTQFPELVKKDEKGFLSVNYSGVVPVLVNAIKEQQDMIDKQQQLIEKLEERLTALEKRK
jgi:hypothetical protein